ncbi:MAG: phosphatidate cytidylyltransferase [Elusimicrobiales bacterium]
MILPRVITAVFGIPIVLTVVYIGGIPFLLFVMFVIIASAWEYYIMMKLSSKSADFFSLFISSATIPIAFYLNGDAPSYNFITMVISFCVILPFFVEVFRKEWSLERIAYTYIASFFISFTLSHLILIRDIPSNGRFFTYILFISVWICDTAAYFFGTKFGKRRLSSVSPKKTLEGFFAGLISCILFFYVVSKNFDILSRWQFIAVSFITAIAGQYSDLAQSLIKRSCGVKDSSNLLPGHGGVFDRFDSYLFLAPLFYYFYVVIR